MQRLNNNFRTFQIYWLNGAHETVKGPSIAEAFSLAGYSGGAIHAIDFYDESERVTHYYDKQTKNWVRKEIASVQNSNR